jgi:putative FmdB family regulatory protein
MPIYDYVCTDCHYEFERKLPMADNSAPESEPCPACELLSVKQFVSQINVGDPVRLGVTKVPSDFNKFVLDRIRNNHPKHLMGNPKAANNIKEI